MTLTEKKKFFRMGEVCRMTGLEPHVLRFWETEFSQLSPRKTRSGQRTYTEQEINLILRIKRLLHEEGYTVAGARKRLTQPEGATRPEMAISARKITSEISEIKGLLKNILNTLDRA